MYDIPKFEILTKRSVYDGYEGDADGGYQALYEEQKEKLKELGIDYFETDCFIHYFDSAWFDEEYIIENLHDAIDGLAIKDGCDLVKFENGNIGIVGYYSGHTNALEIVPEKDFKYDEDDEDEFYIVTDFPKSWIND